MPFLLRNIELNPGEVEELLAARIMARFSLAEGELTGIIVRRKGIDARKKQQIKFIYTIEFTLSDETGFWRQHHLARDLEIAPARETPLFRKIGGDKRIVIVGTGPAGLFSALRLAEYGLAPIVLER